jgi:hypothetical protein
MKTSAIAGGIAVLTVAATLGIVGCGSAAKQAAAEASSAAPKVVIPDLVRAANRTVSTMQNPKERFHVSMQRKYDDKLVAYVSEADFTPDGLGELQIGARSRARKHLSSSRSNTNA